MDWCLLTPDGRFVKECPDFRTDWFQIMIPKDKRT
jgi:hypothetical protein